MIGIVIVTHGRLATEFRAAVEHIVGAQDAIETVPIGPDDDMERRRSDVIDAVAAADRGHGVIILTDMFGGTPCNLAISVMETGRVEVIACGDLEQLQQLHEWLCQGPPQARVDRVEEHACEAQFYASFTVC